jgi:hypothetical protein
MVHPLGDVTKLGPSRGREVRHPCPPAPQTTVYVKIYRIYFHRALAATAVREAARLSEVSAFRRMAMVGILTSAAYWLIVRCKPAPTPDHGASCVRLDVSH